MWVQNAASPDLKKETYDLATSKTNIFERYKTKIRIMEAYSKIYKDNLANSEIPFWLKHSPDYKHGGTFTCLDQLGNIYDTKKYIWLQGRSVWMFSRLYNEFERNEQFLKTAQLGLRFIEKFAFDSKGRYYFSLTQDGKPFFYQRKVYSAVFCMLAYLEYGKAIGKKQYIQKAEDLFWDIKKWIENPSLLDRPVMEGNPATSSLADVMVLASMALELAEIEPKQEYLDIMAMSLKRVVRHFDDHRNILVETKALDGTDLSAWPEGRLFNPGHSIEVAWFILHMLKFLPDSKMQKTALDVIEGSLEFGWDKEFGGFFYFMDIENKPTLQLESTMKLWWPHTEALYATMLAYKLTRDSKWAKWHQLIHEYTFEHFVDKQYLGWFGYCDRAGNLTSTAKGGNYKGFFHAPRAMLMCHKLYN